MYMAAVLRPHRWGVWSSGYARLPFSDVGEEGRAKCEMHGRFANTSGWDFGADGVLTVLAFLTIIILSEHGCLGS